MQNGVRITNKAQHLVIRLCIYYILFCLWVFISLIKVTHWIMQKRFKNVFSWLRSGWVVRFSNWTKASDFLCPQDQTTVKIGFAPLTSSEPNILCQFIFRRKAECYLQLRLDYMRHLPCSNLKIIGRSKKYVIFTKGKITDRWEM